MDELNLIEKNILAGWNTQAIKTCFIVNNITMDDCIESNSPECVKWLLNNGYDVHAENDYALHWASSNGHLEVVKELLDAGADVHAKDDWALQYASQRGHLEVVKVLLEAGADVHAEINLALRWASDEGHLEVVKLLLEAGANIHAIDDKTMDEVTFQDN